MILVIYQWYHIVNQIVQSALKRFRIFSNLYDFQRVGIPITCINEWTGEAVPHCHGKVSSYIPTPKVIRSCYCYVANFEFTGWL